MRVQIPAYTDRWMMGDRYGDVIKVGRDRSTKAARADPLSAAVIATVRLDKSGKAIRVVLDDCTVIEHG